MAGVYGSRNIFGALEKSFLPLRPASKRLKANLRVAMRGTLFSA